MREARKHLARWTRHVAIMAIEQRLSARLRCWGLEILRSKRIRATADYPLDNEVPCG